MKLAIKTGVASLSIEDSTGNAQSPLFPLGVAVERQEAARQAIYGSSAETSLIGRAENFFVGVPDMNYTLIQFEAYAAAGADCLFAPGVQTREQIKAVFAALAPRPVRVLIGSRSMAEDLAPPGVRRVSSAERLRGLQGVASAGGGFSRLRNRSPMDTSTGSLTPPQACS